MLPYAALVFCEVHWLSPHVHVGWECPLSEPSLPCEARLQSHPEDQAGTCPDGCASPAAAIDIHLKTHLTKARSHHRGGDADRNISICSQAFGPQKEFYASLDKRWMSRRVDWPMNKTPSVLISSPLNKLLIQMLAPRWTFTGSQNRREEPSVVFLSHYDDFDAILKLTW